MFQRLLNTYWRHKLYDSLDTLPMWNWRQVLSTGDTVHLVEKFKYGRAYKPGLHFSGLYNSYIKRFGLDKDFERYLKNINLATRLRGEIAERGDAFKIIRLKELDLKIEAYEKRETVDFELSHASLEKFLGYAVNIRVESVAGYEGKLKLFRTAIKAQEKQQENGRNKSRK